MNKILRYAFFILIVKPFVLLCIGVNIRHRCRLPKSGPAIIVANHNSHLDTLVLMSLFPLSMLPKLQPVAAVDYFLRNKFIAWFALNIIGIIPFDRTLKSHNPLAPVEAAIKAGQIIILYPEGSRGEPEHQVKFKNGIWHILKSVPETPVVPVFLHGLGKALPRGEAIFVPFFCDTFVGNSLGYNPDRALFMQSLEAEFKIITDQGGYDPWV